MLDLNNNSSSAHVSATTKKNTPPNQNSQGNVQICKKKKNHSTIFLNMPKSNLPWDNKHLVSSNLFRTCALLVLKEQSDQVTAAISFDRHSLSPSNKKTAVIKVTRCKWCSFFSIDPFSPIFPVIYLPLHSITIFKKIIFLQSIDNYCISFWCSTNQWPLTLSLAVSIFLNHLHM